MIARPETLAADPVAEVLAEAAREAADAVYVVPANDDRDALELLGLEAVVAARLEQVRELAGAAADAGRVVILVGSVGAAVRAEIRSAAPHAMLRRLAEPESPALAVGYCGSVTHWTMAETVRHRETWLSVASEAQVDTAPAELADDGPADYVPPPVELLPRVLRTMVERGAEAQGTDVGFWVTPALGILAGAVGSTRRVALKADWSEPCVLWSAVVAVSGAGKSPPLRELLRPVAERNRILHERSEALRQAHESAKAACRESGEAAPEPPPVLRATVGDVTLEALGSRLADNHRGVLLAVDELASWFGTMDRYRSGGDAAAWLQIHGGDALQVDRRTTGSIYIRSACVSVCGTIQPSIARRVVATEQHRASGLAARILLAMPNLSAPRWTDRVIGEDARSDYAFVVNGLLDLEHDADGEPVVLRLSDEARELFIAYFNDAADTWLSLVRAGDADVAAVGAKLRGGAARIALVVALARAAEDGTAAMVRTIEAADMRAGIALARWFGGEAARLYSHWRDDEAQAAAGRERGALAALADRLAKRLQPGQRASMRELRAFVGNNIPAEQMRAALAILCGSGHATKLPADRSRPGRPAELYEGRDPSEGVSA